MIQAFEIGKKYVSKMENADNLIELFEIPKIDFTEVSSERMIEKMSIVKKNSLWKGSAEIPVYDTPSGDLEDGYFTVTHDNFAWVKETGKPTGFTGVENIKDGEIVDYELVDYSFDLTQ